jgi:hypothetical protein
MANRHRSEALAAIAGLLLLAGLPALAETDGQGARQDPQPTEVLDDTDIRFDVDVSPRDPMLGQPFKVTVSLAYPEGTRVYFPEAPQVRPFTLVRHDRTGSGVIGSGTGETHVLTLLPTRPGTASLAPIEVPFVDPAGKARISMTPEIRLPVTTSLGNETDPQLADAGEPVPVRVTNTPLIWVMSSLAVALIAALLGILGYRFWRRWREAGKPPPPPRPAHEVALERLDDLDARDLAGTGDFGELAQAVSEIIREFLGAHFGFAGVDLTTWEVIRECSGRDLGRLTIVELEDFLSLCDLIKFAKFRPTDSEARSLTRRGREVVEGVMAAVPPAGGTDEA